MKSYPPTSQTMTKKAIVDILIKTTGKVFLTATEAANVLGVGPGTFRTKMAGVEYIPFGNTKRYLVDNIAGRLMELKKS